MHVGFDRVATQAEYVIVEGKNSEPSSTNVRVEELKIAHHNFRELRCLAMEIVPGLLNESQQHFEQLLQRIRKLPNEANSKNSPSPPKPASPPQPHVQRNKKVYRAQQKTQREQKP